MVKPILLLALGFSFQILAGQETKEESITIIKSLRTASNEFIAKRNADEMAMFYLDDFIVIRGNGSQLAGKDKMVAAWKEMFKNNPEVSFIRNPEEIIVNDQNLMAWETGIWIGINTYSKGGNYSAMWRKMGVEWKLQAELFVALK